MSVVTSYSNALKQISKVATSNVPIRKILNSIVKSVARAMEADGATIMLLSASKEYLSVVAACGLSDIYLRKGALNVHKSLSKVMEGRIQYIRDISQAKDVQYPLEAKIEKIKGVIGVPISFRDEIVGELRIYTCDYFKYSTDQKEFLSTVAGIIALILKQHNMYSYSQNVLLDEKGDNKVGALVLSDNDISSRPQSFVHPSEELFARILDFYRIEWLYEPRSFPLEWNNGQVIEMFTPDFYLPEFNLYVELTTLKQSLITEKNRKIRKLKELYPDVNIRLINKNDFMKLLVKYGYMPIDISKVREIERVLLNHSQIQNRVRVLANQISADYAGKQIVLIGILKGVMCFISDLMRNITLPVNIEFMAVSYFETNSEQPVRITKDIDIDINNRHVLMVEDIVDTGMTLNYVLNYLWSKKPASLKVCTLLDKKVRRLVAVPIDYVGFEIPDEFVVGYGLDYLGDYRNLPFIGVLRAK